MIKKYIELALANIINFGDTDIFPFPIETRIFQDSKPEIVKLITDIDKNFDSYLNSNPPVNIDSCVPAGYTGFRWATQIDPIWNAYFLSLVLSLADNIEKARLPKNKNTIFSYRFQPDFKKGSLFDKEVNWRSFQECSIKKARASEIKHVVMCDIADFYTRVSHHRLENELDRVDSSKNISNKVKKLIQTFTNTVSTGLPIGCPASRILAELALNSLDHILQSKGVKFSRFVDDYHIFCSSLEEAHSLLTFVSQKLMKNENLTLQKSKTLILSEQEFIKQAEMKLTSSEEEGSKANVKFMSLPITYDPYSPTAEQDYKKIKRALRDFDLLGMLNDELRKSKINQPFGKHLIKSFTMASDEVLSDAFLLIVDKLSLLYPIFSTIINVAALNWERVNPTCKYKIRTYFVKLVLEDSYILKPELHSAFLCKLLAKDPSPEVEEILINIYEKNSSSILITSLIIQIMAKWNKHYWISDLKQNYQTMNSWQRKAFIIASYILNDEGAHWRQHMKDKFNKFEDFYREWAAMRKQENNLEVAL